MPTPQPGMHDMDSISSRMLDIQWCTASREGGKWGPVDSAQTSGGRDGVHVSSEILWTDGHSWRPSKVGEFSVKIPSSAVGFQVKPNLNPSFQFKQAGNFCIVLNASVNILCCRYI